MLLHPLHAPYKVIALLKSKAGKLVNPLSLHASLKFTLVASVPSFAPAGNDVRAEQDCHEDVKLVQSGACIAGNELRDELK